MPPKGSKTSEKTKQLISLAKKKQNKYDFFDEYIIGYTRNGYEFYIDLDDYDKVKNYCWHKHQDGYLRTRYDHYKDEKGKNHNKYILMHNLIIRGLDEKDYSYEIDHINGKPNDNRKENLRKVTHEQNMKNVKIANNNTSGYKGVYYNKRERKWKAMININNKQIHLGTFMTKEEAVEARMKAENEYYGNFVRKKEDLNNGTR